MMLFAISVLAAFGIAVLLVEKGDDWPISVIRNSIKDFIGFFLDQFANVVHCTVCCAFWAALFSDIFLFYASGFTYFMWPITGFAASGVTWFLIEFLNAIDRKEGS